MTDKDTGGPAFPGSDWVNVPDCENPNAPPYKQVEYGPGSGMTLRDWFAGQVAAAAIVNATGLGLASSDQLSEALGGVARISYALADAMLAERDK